MNKQRTSPITLPAELKRAAPTRSTTSKCVLVCLLALAATAPTASAGANEPVRPQTNSIKRYMFSADNFAAVEAEFARMEVVLSGTPQAPARGHTAWAVGTGGSGYATRYMIDQVDGRFHVYAERRRPQHPVAPFPYVTQEVVFDTPDPGVSLVGTLSYPSSDGSFPGVVLVAGSGGHDRDAGMSLHKTLLVLADHLTRQGFAVLRYDKRGVGLSGGALHPGSTTDEYAADALAAVRFLKLQPNVNPAQIGVVGHSEGGIIASMVASQAPEDVRFIVMLAGTGLPGRDIKSMQDAAARRADGMPESLVLLNRMQERELLEIAASTVGHDEAISAMHAATDALPDHVKTELEIPPEGLPVEAFESLLSPWFRRFLALDPREYLQKVTCPVLAVIGEKDLQVPPEDNLAQVRNALEHGGNGQLTERVLADLNHNFQTARSGAASEYFLIEETVAPSALALLSTWMTDIVRGPAQARTSDR